MNKTVNINIGGLIFHIDEDAFQKLTRYFDAIRRSLSNSSGHEEIMKDIEMRVAELFSERQKSDKHVINLKDVDEVVKVMGNQKTTELTMMLQRLQLEVLPLLQTEKNCIAIKKKV